MRRREFRDSVRAEIVRRATNAAGHPVCEGCGGVLKRGQYELDHVVAEALITDKSNPLTASDGQLLGYCCHRGENGKTAKDVTAIAKSKRQERNFLGYRKRSRNPMPGSKASKWRKPFNGPAVLR